MSTKETGCRELLTNVNALSVIFNKIEPKLPVEIIERICLYAKFGINKHEGELALKAISEQISVQEKHIQESSGENAFLGHMEGWMACDGGVMAFYVPENE